MQAKTARTPVEALDELNREFNVRSRCFPRWIADGRVSKTDAQDRIDRLATAIELLSQQLATEIPSDVAVTHVRD